MWYGKILTYLFLIVSMLSSCELFGGHNNSVQGGEVVWKVENQEILTVSTQPLISKGNVYFIQDAQLKAYTLKGGKRLWSKQLCQAGRTCDYSHTILENNDRLFIDQGFSIQAHSKTNGSILWETSVTSDAEEVSGIGSPIMSQDEEYLYAGRKGYVLKVRKSDGKIIHSYPLDRLVPEGVTQGSTEPIISPYGDGILYVPASYYDRTTPGEEEFGGNLFAFDSNTGEIKWETKVQYYIENYYTEEPNDSLKVSPPIYDIAVSKSLIILLHGKAIVALDRATGKIEWINNFPNSGFDVGLTIEGDGIYAASVGHHAHKLDLYSGNERWRKDITFANTSIPTVQNNRLFFTNSGGGSIWVLDVANGNTIYHKRPPNYTNDSFDVYISSLGVGEGYMVNVGSKAVYCLKVP